MTWPPKFDQQGHLRDFTQNEILQECSDEDRRQRLVRHWFFRATPMVFDTADDYSKFVDAFAKHLNVHPHNIHVRGSGLLGYSLSPSNDVPKAWKPMDRTKPQPSDIDVAIADVDMFDRWKSPLEEWLDANRPDPRKKFAAWWKLKKKLEKQCIYSKQLPHGLCTEERAAIHCFDTTAYCGRNRHTSAFVFRDWQALEDRCVRDIQRLWDEVVAGRIGPPG